MFPQSSAPAPAFSPGEYSAEERIELLNLAHHAIEVGLAGGELSITAASAHLAAPRGAFTTLHLDGKLRGCVGYVLPMYPLYRTVAETAMAAALHDDRFSPVTTEEAARVHVEISVLSAIAPIRPEEVALGKHGLIVSFHMWRGLLLPQVPLERGWDLETFIGQTCRKAGLPADAWKTGATLEAFTAEVFAEPVPLLQANL